MYRFVLPTKGAFVFICTIILSSCAFPIKQNSSSPGIDVSDEISQGSEKEYHPSPQFGKVKLEINPAVQKWLNYFQGRGRRHMNRYLTRSTKYMPLMKRTLRRRGMPEELVYVPLIESGFSSSANSHASAVGYWQFISETGKRYGLKINNYVDERRDPIHSTEAAAEYYSALYNLFGDWYLALAAYNTGEHRVKRALMKYRTRNFWDLAKRKKLPRETRNYVPKFIAAALIHQNPDAYGFSNVKYQSPLVYDIAEVIQPVSLLKLSKHLGLPYKDIKKLNPSFRSDYVPIYRGNSTTIRIPKGYADRAAIALSLSVSNKPLMKVATGYFRYKVRRGDTLSGIAHKYRTRVSTLRRLNKLRRRSFIRVGQRLKVPENGYTKRAKRSSSKARVNYSGKKTHKVRRGENLSVIAQKYGTSIRTLRRLNRLNRRSMIRAGQKLILPGYASTKKVAKIKRKASVSGKVHVVKTGENLSWIAAKHGLTVGELRSLNSLGRRSLIKSGQVLVIKKPDLSRTARIHIVRQGENLSVIAKKYGITVRKIADANALRSRSRIYAGKTLIIPD